MFAKIFKPNSEKIFVASVPFLVVIPVVTYVVLNFFFNLEAGLAGKVFSMIAFLCYNFIALFAIPFEGLLGFLGMLEYGGGMFEYNMLGADLVGILLVQSIYAVIFYAIFSASLFFRSGKRMKHIFGARG